MSLIIPANTLASGGYEVDNSLRFNKGSSDYLNRTFGTSTSEGTWTYSVWLKISDPAFIDNHVFFSGGGASDNRTQLYFGETTGTLNIYRSISGSTVNLESDASFRDPSAWYNLCVQNNAGTVAAYINGVAVTLDGSSLGTNVINKSNTVHKIGVGATATYASSYMSEIVFIDGTVVAPTSFGEFDEDSGIWKPIDVSGLTFGTNGFYLDFEDSSALGNDAAGSNNFTVNNLTAVDQSTDTCTNNFATWNSLQPTNATLTEGNLVGASSASSGHYSGISSIGVSSGKWYFECKQIQESASNEGMIGIIIFYNTVTALLNPVGRGGAWGMQDGNRGFSTDSGGSGSTTDNFHAGWANNDTIGIALDIDNSRVYYSKGGQWNNSGSWNAANPTTSQTLQNALGDGTYFFMAGDASGSNNNTWSANFGSPTHAVSSGNTDGEGFGNFEFAVPSGYFALCTKNLAEYG